MASDADSVEPAGTGEAHGQNEAGDGDAAGPDFGAAARKLDEGGAEAHADAVDDADAPVQVAARGRPSVFLLLTCGFIACMCCLGLCFTGVTVGVTRTANLETALRKVGEPAGWKSQDRTVRPWSASATLVGPDSAEDVATWLDGLGEEVSDADAKKCLDKDGGCDAESTVDGFAVLVHYGPTDGGAEATVQIGRL